ncbi:hypothetical protein [Caminibacter pacificus]
MKVRIKIKELIFILLFIIGSVYILFVKSELYYSNANVVIKNLNNKSVNLNGLSFLMPSSSNQQDIFIIRKYLESFEELNRLDKKFNLKKHYSSDEVDIVDRLKPWNTKEDFLKLYLKRLVFIYDQTTGLITIGFLHTNPQIAYEIVNQLIKDSNTAINKLNKIIIEKQLSYIQKEVEKNKKALEESIQKLEHFQNIHAIIDPMKSAESEFTLLSQLKATLIQKQAQLNDLLQYMNNNSFEVRRLKHEIVGLKKTINKLKKDLANPNKKALNAYIFEFERLKNLVEFNKELYKQSLLQLEQLKVQANQNSKMLLEVTKPFVPQGYMYPQKLKDMITLTLVLLLLYGIISLIQAIIKEHID